MNKYQCRNAKSVTYTYRTVNVTVFLEPNSEYWFWQFPFDWSTFRSTQGFKTYSGARENAENRVDSLFSGSNTVQDTSKGYEQGC